MKTIVAVCFAFALFGWGDASKVESLVYEKYGGMFNCSFCTSDAPSLYKGNDEETARAKAKFGDLKACSIYHPIKRVAARRKDGVEDVWEVAVIMECTKRGEVSFLSEWSYRKERVHFICGH